MRCLWENISTGPTIWRRRRRKQQQKPNMVGSISASNTRNAWNPQACWLHIELANVFVLLLIQTQYYSWSNCSGSVITHKLSGLRLTAKVLQSGVCCVEVVRKYTCWSSTSRTGSVCNFTTIGKKKKNTKITIHWCAHTVIIQAPGKGSWGSAHMHVHARKEKGSPHARPTTPPKVLMLLKWLALGYKAVTVAVLGRSLTCC